MLHLAASVVLAGFLFFAPAAAAGQATATSGGSAAPTLASRDRISRERESIVVFPFINISGQPADEWIGAGIAETVVADLRNAGTLSIVGPEAVQEVLRKRGLGLNGSDGPLAIELSRELGAAWLVTGGYQRLGDLVRITARAMDVRTGDIASTAKVDGRLDEIFTLQDRVVAALGVGPGGFGAAQPDRSAGRAPGTPTGAAGLTAGERSAPRENEGTGSARGAQATPGSASLVRAAGSDRAASEVTAALGPGSGSGRSVSGVGLTFEGPPPPVLPEVISRAANGRATVRAVRVAQPLRVDGALEEAHYRAVPAMTGFIQVEPHDGEPASEQTEVWLSYDDDNVYVSFRCWDSQMERLVANEMRRDNGNMFQGNDIVGFAFDTYHDRRNNVTFIVNPLGGRQDGQATNEQQYSGDWNPVWSAKTGRFEGGWTIETAIPFKSLKYRSTRAQVWGFNVMRIKRSKNEISYLTPVSKSRGQNGLRQMSVAAAVVGLETPSRSLNLDVKPYVISDLATSPNANPPVSNEVGRDFGLDVKYGVTPNLTADFTYNTDFAQVEADEQQINLTRFSLFFPEKRDFFLENQGTFGFGGVAAGGFGGGDAPVLFYSRRIGLNRGSLVPLEAGGRLTGRLGKFTIGGLQIRADDEPVSGFRSTDFSVLRVKRDILRKSSVGAIYTGRSVAESGAGTNEAYGVDGTFGFFQNLAINTYFARTKTDGLVGDDTSYRAQLDYPGDRYGLQLEHLTIGDNFNPQVGFVRRDDIRRNFAQFRFSPRPRSIRSVRKFSYMGSMEHIEDGSGRLETRERTGEFAIEFQNADRFSVIYTNVYEFLPRPFTIARGITLPVGGYDFDTARIAFNMSQQRKLSVSLTAEYGTFYNGTKSTLSASRGRLNLSSQLSVEPTYTINRIELDQGSFTTHLAGSRVTYTMTPLMFASALVQYSSDTQAVTANVRWRWEYRPGSELFVVYNEERNTRVRGFPTLSGRALIIKVNSLFRF